MRSQQQPYLMSEHFMYTPSMQFCKVKDVYIDRQTNRQTGRQIDGLIDKQIDMYINTYARFVTVNFLNLFVYKLLSLETDMI